MHAPRLYLSLCYGNSGFRFVEVTSTGNALKLSVSASSADADDDVAQISMIHFHSALTQRAHVHFPSSDTLNTLQTMALGAQRSNFMTVPTDCDQRESV